MKKKLLALLLAVTMLVSALPFSVFAEDAAATEDLTYTTGLNDGAVYALKVPTTGKSFGQAYQWSNGGYNLSLRHEDEESFILYDQKAFDTFGAEFNTSIYAAGTTYAPDLAKKNSYPGGVPETADVSNTKYLAIRIKINDNNPVGSYTVSRFKPYISCGGQYGMHGTTTNIPAYWYDLNDGSYNAWFGNNGFWKSTEGAFSVVGNADGYIILPYTLNSGVTAAKIASSYTNLQFFFYEGNAVTSGDNQRKAASWDNKEFMIGDAFFIEDIEKFVTAQNADRGIVRYSSNKGDTAWIAQKANGATRNAVRGWAWPGGKSFVDPTAESNVNNYNYVHVAKMSETETGLVMAMNTGKTGGNWGMPMNGTYETSHHATDKFNSVDGIPEAIDLSKMTYIAQRLIVRGTEANPLNGQGFRFYLNNSAQTHCNSNADVILIDDGKVSTVKYNGGIDLYEDFDGWVLVSKSGWTDAYWSDAHTTWSGVQLFTDGDWTGYTAIMGNVYFVEDAEAFKLVHSNPTITEEELLISENSIIVKEPNAKYTYSIDNETWNSEGIFRGLTAKTNYTLYVKNTLNGLVGNIIVNTTNAYATAVGDSGYYYMAVPDEETYIRYNKGMGWSSSFFWRNYKTGEYQPDNQSGNAAVFVEKVGNETFVNLTMNPAYNEKAFPFCPNHSMVPNMLTLGDNNFTGAYDVENITHLAMRFKITGLEEGKSAKLGVLAEPFYFWDCSTAYLIDYETKEVTDPGWTGEQIIFNKNFDGWVVFPLDNMGSDSKKKVTYKDASGADASYELTFKQALFNQIAPINGEKNSISNYQFWFHNDDEANNDGVGNEGCSHWVQNSDWRNVTLYMGDMVVFSDKEAFETTRLSCDYAGHSLVVDEKAATCTEDGYKKTTCAKCDYAETITYEAEGHDYIVDEKAATCTEDGYKKTTCSKCDYYAEETYAATEHDYIVDEKAATCTEDGYKKTTCSKCDYYAEETYAATEHDYIVDEKAATCTEDGYKKTTCSKCDYYAEETYAAEGHDYVVDEKAATCTEDGYKKTTCSKCDYYAEETYAAEGHDYVVDEKAATCTENGYKKTTCSKCDYYAEETYAAEGHDYVVDEKAATCTEDGYKKTTCSKCDYYAEETYAVEGHDYVVDEKAANCTEDGYKKTTCSKCDFVEEVVYTAEGHDYIVDEKAATCTEAGYKNTTCSKCDYAENLTYEAAGHKFVTNETATYCEICNFVESGNIADNETITVSWDAVDGAIKYFVKIQNGDWYKVVGTTETNVKFIGLEPGVEYTITINTKLDTGKYTGYVDEQKIKTVPLAVCDLEASFVDGYVTLNFGSETGDKYWVKRVYPDGSVKHKVTTEESIKFKYPAGEYTFFVIARAKVDGEYVYVKSETVTVVVPNNVASITTLKKALASSATNITIVLADDIDLNNENIVIPKGKNVTIDLNGNTIEGVATSAKASNLFHVKAGATLTLTGDGVVSHRATTPDTDWGEGKTNAYPGYANNTIRNEGTLVIDGVTLYNYTERGGASYVIDNYAGSSLTVESGVIEQKGDDVAIRAFANGAVDITVNGGEILGCRAIWLHLPGSDAKVAPKVDLTINGGTFTSTRANSAQPVIYSYSFGNSFDNTTVTINGGTFLGSYLAFDGYTGTLNGASTVVINGGEFEQEVWQYIQDDAILLMRANMNDIESAEDLVDALVNAEDGETIVLADDIDLTTSEYNSKNRLVISANDLVIDLNGNKLTAPYYTLFFAGDNLTIKNGDIASNGSYGIVVNGKNALIENVTTYSTGFNISNYTADDLAVLPYQVSATIKDCVINSSTYYAICAQGGSYVEVDNCEINVGAKGTACFYIQEAYVDGADVVDASCVVVLDNTVINLNGKPLYLKSALAPVMGSAAATAEDIADVIANADEAATIILTDDIALDDANITIPKGKDVTIDLNGKTIEGVATSAKASNLFHVKAGATLTLKGDGVVSYRATTPDTNWGEGKTNAYPGYANNTIRNEGALVIDGVTLYNYTERGGASYVIDNYAGSSLTVESGVIEQKGGDVAIRAFANGAVDITVNDGEILGSRAIWVQLPSKDANVAPKVNVTINGGTFTSTREDGSQPVIYVYTSGNSLANTKLVINGGTFLGSYIGLDGGVRNGTASVTEINGGNFEQPVWRFTDSETILVQDANM